MGQYSKIKYYTASIPRMFLGFTKPLSIIAAFVSDKACTMKLRSSPLTFEVRGKMDLWSLKETFLDRFYEKLGTQVMPGWTVIDIGAGFGDFSIFAAQPANAKVLAFEPFTQSFELLEKNVNRNFCKNIHCYNLAVWSESGSLVLDNSEGDALKVKAFNSADKKDSVEAISLEQAINLSEGGICDLLKLDCEGAEYPILMTASENVLKRVKRIVMEYHDFVGMPGHKALASFLSERGYKVSSSVNAVHDNLGYLYAEQLV